MLLGYDVFRLTAQSYLFSHAGADGAGLPGILERGNLGLIREV